MKRLAGACAAAVLTAGCGGHERADPAVVRVELEGATSAAEIATGFVAARGRVVTVAHVLEPGRRLVVRTGGRVLRGRVLRVDRGDDLALIAVPTPGTGSAALHPGVGSGSTRILVVRDGGPEAIDSRVRRPIRATVRGPGTGPYRRPALELDARVRLGDSGAPVLDGDGRVAGVVFARASNGSPTTYAVDASAIHDLLAR
jgi:S1-C subfamily serine protease